MMTATTEALFEVSESPQKIQARVTAEAQKAVGRVGASVGADLDRIEQALRAGGSYAEMKALVTAHESLVGVHKMLQGIEIGGASED